MNTIKKRAIALIALSSIIISSVLYSCADNSSDIETNAVDTSLTDTEETETEDTLYYTDEAPTIDFEQETIYILTPDGPHIVFDEPSDNLVDNAKYRATISMEERFNCNMEEITSDGGFVNFTARNLLSSGSDDYDFITPFGVYAHVFAEEGK